MRNRLIRMDKHITLGTKQIPVPNIKVQEVKREYTDLLNQVRRWQRDYERTYRTEQYPSGDIVTDLHYYGARQASGATACDLLRLQLQMEELAEKISAL